MLSSTCARVLQIGFLEQEIAYLFLTFCHSHRLRGMSSEECFINTHIDCKIFSVIFKSISHVFYLSRKLVIHFYALLSYGMLLLAIFCTNAHASSNFRGILFFKSEASCISVVSVLHFCAIA